MDFKAKNQEEPPGQRATRSELFSIGEQKTVREPIRLADFQ